ncbi:hypothetical protein GCM10027610_019090 [Dactylosporangium cerinum]
MVAQDGAGLDHAALDGLAEDAVAVEAAAVVVDLDDDGTGVVERVEPQLAPHRLALPLTVGAGFDAVVQRVADQVEQRVADPLDEGLVHLRLAAGDDQVDVLVEVDADVADHPFEPAQGRADRHHAQRQGAVAHLLDEAHDLALCLVVAFLVRSARRNPCRRSSRMPIAMLSLGTFGAGPGEAPGNWSPPPNIFAWYSCGRVPWRSISCRNSSIASSA